MRRIYDPEELHHDEVIKSLLRNYKAGKSNLNAPLPEHMHYYVEKQADAAILLAVILGFDTTAFRSKFEIFYNKEFEALLVEYGLLP